MCDSFYHIRIIPQGHETFSIMASYENEEQVLKVIQELGAAIQRGDETFSFPTIEEVNAVEVKKFEVGKTYKGFFGEICKIIRRTEKTVVIDFFNFRIIFRTQIIAENLFRG